MSEWPMVKLGDVANFVRGLTFKPSSVIPTEKGLIVLRTKNIQEKLDLTDLIAIPQDFLKREDQLVQSLDTLVSVANSWNLVGKCCIAPLNPTNLAIGGFIAALRSLNADKLDPQYLYHWFNSTAIQNTVRSFSNKTTNISNLQIKRCLDLMIPLPPLGEQKRIAEILQKSAESIKQIIYEIEGLEKLSLSVADHFIRAEVPDKQPLNELVDFHGGSTPSKKNKDFWTDNGICWFTSKDLKFDELADSLDHITKKATSETALKPVSEKKSIAISLRGMSLAHRVPMSIIPGNSCVNQDLKALIPKEDMDIYVLFTLLKREEKFLLTKVSSSAHGTRKLDFPYIKTLSVPKLKIDQICRLKQRLQGIQQLKNCLVRKLALLQELQRSLSARAFTGQL